MPCVSTLNSDKITSLLIVFAAVLLQNGSLDYGFFNGNRNMFHLNEQVFEEPFQITTAADLQQVREALLNLDVLEWVRQ